MAQFTSHATRGSGSFRYCIGPYVGVRAFLNNSIAESSGPGQSNQEDDSADTQIYWREDDIEEFPSDGGIEEDVECKAIEESLIISGPYVHWEPSGHVNIRSRLYGGASSGI
mmetsp:Transcript_17976/g.25604  ORF Transcript_17976/g.25604 Transcript_17976/m.25604 type:complete len:112 (-) Transcript_17976:212-547(-)